MMTKTTKTTLLKTTTNKTTATKRNITETTKKYVILSIVPEKNLPFLVVFLFCSYIAKKQPIYDLNQTTNISPRLRFHKNPPINILI